jgi:signal transduction histidine kinase
MSTVGKSFLGGVSEVTMLDDFLVTNRDTIIALARARVAERSHSGPADVELSHGVPVFLDQLGRALREARASDVIDHEQIGKTAARHGGELLQMGLSIGQVVRGYGDVCQVITELAIRLNAPLAGDEFQTLNLCLDDAIAEAVTEYSNQSESSIRERNTEHLGVLAHELRNFLNTATLAFDSIQSGHVAPGGSTAAVLKRSLRGLRNVIDRSLAEVRLDAGVEVRESILVAEFVEEVEIGAAMDAQARGQRLDVSFVERTLSVEGDRHILSAALSNLLQNAFKFTPRGGRISLRTTATAERVVFEVEDECGGLPPGKIEELFQPFEQRGGDRSGIGLGLSISRKAAATNGGKISVRDLPDKGCIFALDLPRRPAPLSIIQGGHSPSRSPTGAAGAGRHQSS